MDIGLKRAVVRITNSDCPEFGTGFVASEDGLIATCAHVVRDIGAEPNDKIEVFFHVAGQRRYAHVVPEYWRDPNAEDISILHLEGDLPEGIQPLPLGRSMGTTVHPFQTYGFSESIPANAILREGRILGTITINHQEVLQLSGQEIDEGFSGAPVWDQAKERVVGMISARAERSKETVFIIPVETLQVVCPTLIIAKIHRLPRQCETEFELVTAETFAGIADRGAAFYNGSEPTWQDIANDADSKRDLLPKILEAVARNRGQPAFLLITGEPGSGKSTLLRRIGLELYKRDEAVLFHHQGRDTLSLHLIREAYDSLRLPIYVLVDDIFRKQNVQGFLNDMGSTGLPLFVIATSRSNEQEETRANILRLTDTTEYELGALSLAEIDGLISKLSERDALAIYEANALGSLKKAMESESQLLALMARLVEGTDFETIIQKELKFLKDSKPEYLLYNAYTYICALYSVGVPTPISLLKRLVNAQNIYRDIINRDEVRGIIKSAQDKTVRARHEFVAEVVANRVWPEVEQLEEVYIDVLSKIDPGEAEERKTALLLFRSLLTHRFQTSALRIFHRMQSLFINDFLQVASEDNLLGGWARVFSSLGETAWQEKCYQLGLERFPDSSRVYHEYARYFDDMGRIDEAEIHYEIASQLESGDTSVANSYAAFLIDHKRFDEATNILEEALESL